MQRQLNRVRRMKNAIVLNFLLERFSTILWIVVLNLVSENKQSRKNTRIHSKAALLCQLYYYAEGKNEVTNQQEGNNDAMAMQIMEKLLLQSLMNNKN